MGERPFLAKAVYPYNPVNNDELKLEKGEILTVIKKEEGGWWEGTLSNGKTGWFPSNYCEEIGPLSLSSNSGGGSGSSSSPGSGEINNVTISVSNDGLNQLPSHNGGDTDTALSAQQIEYRQIALKELVESEATHLAELEVFWDGYLVPLQKSEILSAAEFHILTGNFPDVTVMHQGVVLNMLKTEQTKPFKDQHIGNLFLEIAPKFEEVHKTYCSNHPKAVQIVERHKEQLSSFIEGKGGMKPGILYLITSLSQPFRRLEKYPALLQEIERHIEEFHKDRGDLQRSIEYYKDILKTCAALRKQKEMELEVLSGAIKNWEGSDVSQLGDIIFMNFVHIGIEREPRYLVLFPNTLLLLSYSTDTNSLVYEGKVPVSGTTLRPLTDKDAITNAFEIAGPMIDPITVNCTSKAVRETWLSHLNSILKTSRYPSFSQSPQQSFGQLTPPVQAWTIDRLRPAPPFNPFLSEYFNALKKRSDPNLSQSKGSSVQSNGRLGGTVGSTSSMMSFNSSYSTTAPTVTNEEEFAVLALVDSFCTTNRHTVSSVNLTPDAKPVASKPQGPRTMAQLVLMLRNEVADLKKTVQDEKKKSESLHQMVQKTMNNNN